MEVGAEHRDPASGGVTVLLFQVLKRGWRVAATPYPKKVLHLPEILSQEEVARVIDAVEFPSHRILLMTLYTLRSLGCHPESRKCYYKCY